MPKFSLNTKMSPSGSQPEAIKELTAGVMGGQKDQTLLGLTGSGKTFTMANVISNTNRPALIISHNKTLAAQLYQEFKEFFPENAVHYFVSYYDYYQPEAYLPASDTYIEKDAKINDFIDKLRHASTQDALTRNDFIIVASVSAIYGIGNPEEYKKISKDITIGQKIKRSDFLRHLAEMQYKRNDVERIHGTFSVKGDTIEVVSPDGETISRVEFWGDEIESISDRKNSLQHDGQKVQTKRIFPAKHFVAPSDKLKSTIKNINKELSEQLKRLESEEKLLEVQRLRQRTNFDMEMLEKTGYVTGIENYSRHLSFREPGSAPYTLLDYIPSDTLVFIDESHMTVPQIRGMYAGDRARKQTLVEYGFRLPSALDNRPLKFSEFEKRISQTVYVSATPSTYEIDKSGGEVVEQLIRPTGLLDPEIEIRPVSANSGQGLSYGGQIKDLEKEILKSAEKGERVLAVTLTKRLAEEISEYLAEKGIRSEYLHSELKTIERSKVLKRLREGDFDVLVGINLLREGLDLPEVALVAILDADKEGFLRDYTSFVQTIGRAARHPKGRAILYADRITGSIKRTIAGTKRIRKIQENYNEAHGITPQAIVKEIRPPFWAEENKTDEKQAEEFLKDLQRSVKDPKKIKAEIERQMLEAAGELRFEDAARLRDLLKTI